MLFQTLDSWFKVRKANYIHAQANPTAHIVERSADCDFQSKLLEEVAAYFFRWKGNLGQIESVSIPDYCLVPYYLNSTVNYMERYYVKLGLEPCNEDVETQVWNYQIILV